MATTSNESIISNLSYTEKDFQSIYPALLDLVKKETAKWDPSASNESDPGVLLLKLNAIIADKCNYNIDKNVLECFPVSVTQDANARQLFEQLGYYMHWYEAAETTVTLKYTGEEVLDTQGATVSYTIPKFTMVCDDESSIVYTMIDEVALKTDGSVQGVSALQGIKVDLTISDSTLITTANLDSNNRVYFTDTRIAENGIFIRNSDAINYSSWERKDNLLVEEVSASNHYYKFGVTQDLNTCYLEFPENAEELFQDGIYVTYIKTSGSEGNISPNIIEAFYEDCIVENPLDPDNPVTLTTDTVSIHNYIDGVDGVDPETINEAYLGYKKTVGTFKTLITLRDYMNAARNSEYVSNAIVSDRTTDVQSSYDIVTQIGSVNQAINTIDIDTKKYDREGYFDAADKETAQICSGTFWIDTGKSDSWDLNLEWNYYDIPTDTYWRLIYIDNEAKYVKCDKVERKALDAFDLKMYLLTATSLMKSAAYYNKTFSLNLDNTIQSIVEAEIDEYKCVQHNFADILLDKICFFKEKYPIDCKIIPQYTLTETQKKEIASNIRTALWNNLNSTQVEFGEEIAYETVYNIILNADSRIKAIALDPLSYTTYVVYLTEDEETGSTVVKELDISSWDTTKNTAGEIVAADTFKNQIRTEIYAKSVLAGKTQFFVKDSKFDYGINQKYQLLEDDIGRLESNLTVELNSSNQWQYNVRPNEAVQLFAPNLIESSSYSSNIRFEYYIPSGVAANSTYMLQAGEFIIFYWTDEATVDSGYLYAVYSKGTIIKPTFKLDSTVASALDLVGAELTGDIEQKFVNNNTYWYTDGDTMDKGSTLTSNVKAMTENHQILSGSRTIYTLLKNSITLDKSYYYCYWIVNEQEDGEYILFDEDSGTTRLLKAGEFFIYTDSTKADMTILGEGTQIIREGFTGRWTCDASITYSDITEIGLLALVNYWKPLPTDYILYLTEMQYIALGDGTVIEIKPDDQRDLTLTSNSEVVLGDCSIRYKETVDATSWITVAKIILGDDDLTWKGRSLLRLNLSTDLSQVLYSGQQITYIKYDSDYDWLITEDKESYYTEEEWEKLKPGTIDPDVEPFSDETHLLTSRVLNDIGPRVSTLTEDDNENKVPISIYAYVNGTMDTDVEILDDGTTNVLFRNNDHQTQEKTITFKLPGGNYIMPIYHTTNDDIIRKLNVYLYPYTFANTDNISGIVATLKDTLSITSSGTYNMNFTIRKVTTYLPEGYDDVPANYRSVETDYATAEGIILDKSSKTVTYVNFKQGTGTATNVVVYENGSWKEGDYKIIKFTSEPTNAEIIIKTWIKNNSSVIGKELKSMGDNTTSNLYKAGNYYLRIDDLTDANSSSFFITTKIFIEYYEKPSTSSQAPVVSALIPPIFKYSSSTSINDTDTLNADLFVKIYEKIKALDYEGRFKYTYEVDGDEEVKDPLSGKSFLDPNHIMNPYTICQLDTGNTEIYVTNTIRSA